MKYLKFIYQTEVQFSGDIVEHGFRLRCIPREEARQHIVSLEYKIWPDTNVFVDSDGYDNPVLYGNMNEPHQKFGFYVEGIAAVDLGRPRVDYHPIFQFPTDYTKSNEAMVKLAKDAVYKEKDKNALSQALCLMNAVYQMFEYKAGSTSIRTTAIQAFEAGQGVCQDYAHILIALCLAVSIPSRYVAGLMLGDGKTHAWVEVCSEGHWYGLDPTNNLMVDENYIKLAHGRNSAEVSVVRGIFRGCVSQNQSVFVQVEEIDYD